MAVTITRTPWIDDDGTGTTGTVINNAVKTALYNDIDGGFAKLAQLTGGNAFTGNQSVAGTLTVSGFGNHGVVASGTGALTVTVQNTAAGATNSTVLLCQNNLGPTLFISSYASTYTPTAAWDVPNATAFYQASGPLSIITGTSNPIRLFTNATERLRITPTGEVFVNCAVNPGLGQLAVVTDFATHQGCLIQNTNATVPGNGAYLQFLNSGAAVAGAVIQATATTVSYGTTSDARLKDDAGRATDVSGLRAVVVHDFAWKADGRTDRGVFAQDAHAVFPRAVTVGTDETTAAGTLKHPWMTDYSKFVPDLIVGWQHHDADLAELRALLVTLKGSADAE
jgi:hypothetical protein